jgi:hypothetical protein
MDTAKAVKLFCEVPHLTLRQRVLAHFLETGHLREGLTSLPLLRNTPSTMGWQVSCYVFKGLAQTAAFGGNSPLASLEQPLKTTG